MAVCSWNLRFCCNTICIFSVLCIIIIEGKRAKLTSSYTHTHVHNAHVPGIDRLLYLNTEKEKKKELQRERGKKIRNKSN